MNKAQMAALLLAGAAAGVGGEQAVSVLFSSAEAKSAVPFTHAVDLRRDTADGGVRVLAYASQPTADGGTRDLGQARSCKPSEKNVPLLSACMNVAALDCLW